MNKELGRLKEEIEEEMSRSHRRQRTETWKEYDFRNGLWWVVRRIEDIEKEEKSDG